MTTNHETVALRVQRVRNRGARAVLFSGLAIDGAGAADPKAPRYAVLAPHRTLAANVQEGQWWRVSGSAEDVTYDVDGWQVHERRLQATKLELLRPSGEHVVQLLARSPAFPGIGEVKARKLWEALGSDLYDALESQDLARLTEHVGADLATVLVDGWSAYGDADAVTAFQRMGLDLSVSQKVLVVNDERGRIEDTGFRLGEPVLCVKNLWHLGLQNGSLGRLHSIEPVPMLDAEGIATYGWVRWDDGELRPVTGEVLDALELGYAITVHKAQGSQFGRVVVPVFKTRNLDRTMLYTAITRATRQVLLVGDRSIAAQVVAAAPSASKRLVALPSFMQQAFQEH